MKLHAAILLTILLSACSSAAKEPVDRGPPGSITYDKGNWMDMREHHTRSGGT